MDITQSTDRAAINWQSFNIGTGASVHIAQPSASSVLLNRVVGNEMSQIRGQISANGQVILVNPNGIVMGPTGRITASAFTASSFGISDADFQSGEMRFERSATSGAVINQGSIESTDAGGYVALIGADVSNQGTITTRQGAVVLAAADAVVMPNTPGFDTQTVSVPLSRNVRLELSPEAFGPASVSNSGVIVTDGGQVLMRAAAVVDAVSKIANATVVQSGSIDTSGDQAGRVVILADDGRIRVSGSVTANSAPQPHLPTTGAGADIYIGRDELTNVLAAVGDVRGAQLESIGGFVETSGQHLLTNGVSVKAKDWLLDPTSIRIVATNTVTQDTAQNTDNNTLTLQDTTAVNETEVLKSTIEAAINNGTNVTISTANGPGLGAGNITIETALSFNNTGAQAATLRLFAVNGITQNTGATITATGTQLVHIDMAAEGRYMGNPWASASSLGITLNSAITTNGDVTLNGRAMHTDAGNATYGIGVNGWTNANIQARNISITGTSANSFGINYRGTLTASGNITQNGTSQNWVGVVSSGTVNATGNLSITGQTISGGYQGINIDSNLTGATVTLNGQSNAHIGVALANARSITSNVSDISITGTSTSGNGINIGSDSSTTGSAVIRSAQNMHLTGQGATNGIRVWFSSQLEAGNSSTPGSINMSGTAVTTSGQSGIGVDFYRYANAASLTARSNINITGTVSGAGTGSGFKTTWSDRNGNGPSMTAGGDFTLRANNRAASTNTSATINADSGMQILAGGDIVVQAETNNNNVAAILLYSTTDMYRGNTSLVSTAGDILIQSNQGGIRFNNQQASTAGRLTDITGRNITIDNTGAGMATGSGSLIGSGGTTGATIGSGSINVSSGAVIAGTGKGLSEGLNLFDARSITASGQLHLNGASVTGEGIKSTANLTGASIIAVGNSDASMGINVIGGSFTTTSGAVNITGRNLVSGGRGMTLSGTVSVVGDVNLSGYSVSTGDRHGMVITNAVASSGGNINLTGQTTASSVPAITITGASAAVSVSNGRSININANSLNLESSATLNAGTGTVNIKTLTTGNEIVVGGSDTLGGTLTSQKLGITNSELNQITAANLAFGSASAGNITVSGATTTNAATGNIKFQTGGNIAINAALTVGDAGATKALTLNAVGANSSITQTAAIKSTGLELLGTNATYTLTNTGNDIKKIAGNTKVVSLTNNSAFAIDTVNTVGLATSGNTTFSSTAEVTENQKLDTAGLELLGVGGSYMLTNTSNNVRKIAGSTGSVSLTNNNAFAIDTVNTIGLTTTGNTTFSSTAAVTQTQKVATAGLELLGTGGTYTLTNAANSVTTLAANTGALSFVNSTNFTVGTVNTSGINTTAGNVTLVSNNGVTVAANITSNDHDMAITANGNGGTSKGFEQSGGIINAGAGDITIVGTTKTATGWPNRIGANVRGTISGNDISITGTSDTATATDGMGVQFEGASNVSATGSLTVAGEVKGGGTGRAVVIGNGNFPNTPTLLSGAAGIDITGTLSSANSGSPDNAGVFIEASGVTATSSSGAINITGNSTAAGAAFSKNALFLKYAMNLAAQNGTTITGTSVGTGASVYLDTEANINVTNGALTIQSGGNSASNAFIMSGANARITQATNAGVTLTTEGQGNITAPKIVNSGTGNVVVAAGRAIAAGTGTGGQVLTVNGNSIAQGSTGKTYIYSGAAASTGVLSNLSSDFGTLYYEGTSHTRNAAFGSAYGSTITAGETFQVFFRETSAPSFAISLPSVQLNKTYGQNDPTLATLRTALQTAYTAASGPTTLTTDVAGAGGSNTFGLLAADAIADLASTRAAGESVNSGTPYAYSLSASLLHTTVSGTASTLVINQAPLAASLTGTVTKQYDGTSDALLTANNYSITGWGFSDGAVISQTVGTYASPNASNNTLASKGLVSASLSSADFTATAGTNFDNYILPTTATGNVGVITTTSNGGNGNSGGNQQPIIHPPKPIIPADNTSGGESGGGGEPGDNSSGNPYYLMPANRPNSADRCTPNTLEDCLCETQEPRPLEGLAICYQPKKTASSRPTKSNPSKHQQQKA
jgi:filamentous hemagglutinin family protein